MKKYLKVCALLSLSVACLLSFSSCEKPGTELSELMIMQGIGIDTTNDGFKVTVELLNNEQSGSPGGNGNSENKTKIYTAEGKTVGEALRKLITKSGNEPMFAHNRVIVIGEEAANRNLSDILDFFERNYDSRASQLLCVAKNTTGEKVIRAKLLTDTIKSKILENMLEESAKQSLVPKVRIIDAINYIKDEASGLCIPAVKIQKNGENENFDLDGCAIFGTDSTFSMYIDSQAAEGIAILNDKFEEGVISADLPNGQKASFYINKGKSKYKIIQENGVLHYNLTVKLSCDLEGVQGAEYFNTDTGVIEAFQTAVGEALCKKAENTLIVLQGKHGADVVRYGKRLRLKENDLYKNMINDWDKIFPEIKLTITTDVTIRRIGEETFHSKKT
ncbi:MAG: Ger(x)C family spore germination protein [Clostridia bacterium]|nr:Ger(x)C family spore germination protein [Clostridia bacterium]